MAGPVILILSNSMLSIEDLNHPFGLKNHPFIDAIRINIEDDYDISERQELKGHFGITIQFGIGISMRANLKDCYLETGKLVLEIASLFNGIIDMNGSLKLSDKLLASIPSENLYFMNQGLYFNSNGFRQFFASTEFRLLK